MTYRRTGNLFTPTRNIWVPRRSLRDCRGSISPALLGVIAARRKNNTATIEAVSSETVGSARNSFDGYVGFRFTPVVDLTVYSLGRWIISGNSQSHTIELRNAGGSVIGSVSVSTSGASAGDYKYTDLASPVTLTTSTWYFIVSQETIGGDLWLDDDSVIEVTGDLTANESCYYAVSPGIPTGRGTPNRSYVIPNFKYSK